MNEETRTMQTADTTPARAPEDAPALVKKIGKTTYKVVLPIFFTIAGVFSGALDAVAASATCIVRGSLFMALLSPNGSVPPGKNQSCLLFTMSFAACRVAPAFSSRKFFPSKRIGAHRSKIRS